MEETISKSLRTLMLWLSVVFMSQVRQSDAGEYCGSAYGRLKWCEYDCCGSYGDEHCCDYNYVGAIVGGIVTLVIVGVIIALIVCCCVASCPLYRRRTQGTILGWGNSGQTVTTTTVHNPQVVTTSAPMQPGMQYGYPQQQGVVMMPPQPQPYSHAPAYPPPAYQQAGQYPPPPAGAPPPAPSTVDTKY